jgi:beta-glucanase (GH16 family)
MTSKKIKLKNKSLQRISKKLLLPFAVLIALFQSTGARAEDPPCPLDFGEWKLIPTFSDEFNGDALDATLWNNYYPGWNGRQPGYFSRDNVEVKDGCLHLWAKKEPDFPSYPSGYHTYTTAAVQSKTKVKYGYFEIRCRPMESQASSAFWFTDNNSTSWTEIDVFEIAGKGGGVDYKYHMNVHVFKKPGSTTHTQSQTVWTAPFRLAADFHVYGFYWSATELIWYVDGQQVRKSANTDWIYPLTMNFDSETFPDWFGLPKDEHLPSVFSIDYVHSWERTDEATNNPPWGAGGGGTESDPYQIATVEHLEQLATDVNGGNSFDGIHFMLTDDIDLIYSDWQPINNFSGSLHGNGKAIRNLTINRPSNANQGLFGILNGHVDKLALIDVNITANDHAGALAGRINDGSVSEVYASGVVNISTERAGGLVGFLNGGHITNSISEVDVTGNQIIGGVVGRQDGNSSITKCYATGSVLWDGSTSGAYHGAYIGGIVGGQWNGSPAISQYCVPINPTIKATGTWGYGRVRGRGEGGTHSSTDNLCWEGTVFDAPNTTHGGVLRTLEELKMDTTYASITWDISTSLDPTKVWYIKNGESFPVFQWQAGAGTSIDKIYAAHPLKAVATAGGLRISGLTPGEDLRLYNTLGQLLYHAKAKAGEQLIPLNKPGLYIAVTKGGSQKTLFGNAK